MTSRHLPSAPVHPHGDNARPVYRPAPGKEGPAIGRVSEPDPVAQAAATRAVLWRLDRGVMTAVEARTVLDVLGLLPEPEPTPERPPEATQDTAPVSLPSPAPENPAEATTAPGTPVIPPHTPDPDGGPTVWLAPGGLAHWPNLCPQRPYQTACSGTPLLGYAAPTPAATIPTDQRCTSTACAARWRRHDAGQPLRSRCDRCRTTHTHEETA